MNNIVEVNVPAFQSSLIDVAKSGYDSVIREKKLSNASAMVMVGYLSACVTAFKAIGDDYHAELFTKTASRIQSNWEEFVDAMQILFQTVDINDNNPESKDHD